MDKKHIDVLKELRESIAHDANEIEDGWRTGTPATVQARRKEVAALDAVIKEKTTSKSSWQWRKAD